MEPRLMLEKHRQQIIKEMLAKQQFISVKTLTNTLKVSEATVRRDINKLSKERILKRIQGGAESLNYSLKKNTLNSPLFSESKDKMGSLKKLIAKKAAQLCKNGDSIIINGGSTTYMMGEFLSNIKLNIMTNSFVLANYLSIHSESHITLPSGELYKEQGIVLSSYDNDGSEYCHGTMMFIGALGIGKFGVMESDSLLIRSEQKLMKRADKIIVLADSSKIGKRCNFILCPLSRVDILITDSGIKKELIEFFESYGIDVLVAES